MSLSLSAHPLLLLCCALLAAGLTYWTYRRTTPQLSTGRRALLGALRFSVLFLVLFLLFEPVVRRMDEDVRPPVLAVLVDDSQSLTLTADSAAVAGAYESLARQALQDVDGRVAVYRFSSDTRRITGDADAWNDSLSLGGQRTDITRALDFVREDLRDENLKSVLLISDGQYNSGRNPLYAAERYPVPVHTAAVGDTASQRDLQVRSVLTNDLAYLGAEQPVRVSVRAEDIPPQQVTVSLMQGGQVLDSENIQLPGGAAEIPVDLAYTPAEAGLHRMTVRVTRLEGEATHQNNDAGFSTRVLDRKRRVLLISTAPDPDLAAVRQVLEEDADTETAVLVQRAAGAFYEQPPSSLSDVDAIVLVGYPGRSADEPFLERVAQAAREGAPLFFLLNRQTDLALLSRYLADVLPVHPEAVRTGFFEAGFVPTAAGARHPILGVEGATPASWRLLPPLAYSDSRWEAKPDAEVLATTEVRGVSLDDPMLAVLRRGNTRSAALLGGGTWRWRNVPEDLAVQEDYWPELLTNTLQWITTREDDRPVRVEPAEEIFAGGDPVRFTGQVYDESLNPVDDAAIEVEVSAPDGTQFPYRMEPLGNGRYALDAGALPEGAYAYTATARQNQVALGTDQGSFTVGSSNLEFRETRANTALMRQIALRSGGTFFTTGQMSSFASTLNASDHFTPEIRTQERETALRTLYILLAAVIVLLSLEWFLRKRSGLV